MKLNLQENTGLNRSKQHYRWESEASVSGYTLATMGSELDIDSNIRNSQEKAALPDFRMFDAH